MSMDDNLAIASMVRVKDLVGGVREPTNIGRIYLFRSLGPHFGSEVGSGAIYCLLVWELHKCGHLLPHGVDAPLL